MFGDSKFRILNMRKEGNSDKKVKINGQWVDYLVNTERDTIAFFWEDLLFGTMKSIEYVTDLFHTDISTMELHENVDNRLLNWVQQRQKSLKNVHIFTDNARNEIYDAEKLKNIILSCKSEEIIIDARSSEELEIPNYYVKCNMFVCVIGKWITMETVMTIDCEVILLCEPSEPKFSGEELNRFLKHWINGGSLRLKTFYAAVGTDSTLQLFDGIGKNQKMEEKVYQTLYGNYKMTFRNWYQIQRNDGVMAAVQFLASDELNFYIFQFAVWPDANGNF
uniref:FBA_2 domain-containing protein n=2 Tax=Caenorhabditis tropicalis TaxID=1561998 RepID=A0A1I7V415_9PELO